VPQTAEVSIFHSLMFACFDTGYLTFQDASRLTRTLLVTELSRPLRLRRIQQYPLPPYLPRLHDPGR
jgi:hypothetical protein